MVGFDGPFDFGMFQWKTFGMQSNLWNLIWLCEGFCAVESFISVFLF